MKSDSCCRFKFLIPVFILAVVALLTWAVQALWNGVLVDVVAVKTVTYWQALGLLLLAKILFGGWPRKAGGHWRTRMWAKRWQSMNPEQREHLREEMRGRFGDWPRPPGDCCKGPRPDDSGKPEGGKS